MTQCSIGRTSKANFEGVDERRRVCPFVPPTPLAKESSVTSNVSARDQAVMWDEWARTFDSYSAGRSVDEIVGLLTSLAKGGRLLELGVGTGIVALEVAKHGLEVVGVDISPAMISALEAKIGDLPVSAKVGDMSQLREEWGQFDVVYAANSTLFCLTSQEEQLECIGNAARVLAFGGCLVLECFAPWGGMLTQARSVDVGDLRPAGCTLSVTSTNISTQRISYRELLIEGNSVTTLPVEERYCWPSELDLMARLAGLRLRSRWEDAKGARFTHRSRWHVSIYEPQPAF
jgi:ubiquinone/menaquinone biosynthesis C-methylase UbiE